MTVGITVPDVALDVLDLRTELKRRFNRVRVEAAGSGACRLVMEREVAGRLLGRAQDTAAGAYHGPASWKRSAEGLVRAMREQLREADTLAERMKNT